MSGRFVFKLRPVLEQRERAEKEQQRRVADLERERLAVEDRLRSYQAGITDAKHDLRDRIVGDGGFGGGRGPVVSVDDIRMQSHATLHMEALARRAVLELAGTYERLRVAREELARLTAARKAVSHLKDRQFDDWKRAVLKREVGELDELAVMRHGRTERES